MKQVIQLFITLVAFVILINISFKVFNTIDPWMGIGAGFISITAFAYTIYKIWKSNSKPKKDE